MENDELPNILANFSQELSAEIRAVSTLKKLPKNTEFVREGQFAKVIPFVLDGLIKVYTRVEGKELLLYYIRPNESCVMSFSTCIRNEASKIFAITEEDTTVLLLPIDNVTKWIQQYPEINIMFFQQYNLRYSELIETIQHLMNDKMDKRLSDYLHEKVKLTNKNPLNISHRQIANELGTAREVVSRAMKKLENEGVIIQHSNNIEVL